jgi:O-methyltransferase
MRIMPHALGPGEICAMALLRRNRGGEKDGRPAQQVEEILRFASDADRRIVEEALPYTMTGVPRLLALIDAVRYCVARGVTGAFAECGVWRGGSVLAMILTLQALGVSDRDIYVYDTFEGMTEPSEADTSDLEDSALHQWREAERQQVRPWGELFGADVFNESAVRSLVLATDYPAHRVHLVKGAVEQTVPGIAPQRLALLRLDTDWYESTRHELVHLFPRLVGGGVIIVDDYGHWRGARRAVNEYFTTEHPPLLFTRIDYTGRIAIKH